RCLIRLQMADQVEARVAEFPHVIRFGSELLHAVLTEDAQSGIVGFTNRRGRKHLADRHERDLVGLASGTRGGGMDALTDARDVLSDQEPIIRSSTRGAQGMPAARLR